MAQAGERVGGGSPEPPISPWESPEQRGSREGLRAKAGPEEARAALTALKEFQSPGRVSGSFPQGKITNPRVQGAPGARAWKGSSGEITAKAQGRLGTFWKKKGVGWQADAAGG